MRVNCKYCMAVKRVWMIDGETNQQLDDWWWFCDCEKLGNEQEVGFDCGKKVCKLWEKKDEKRQLVEER